MSRPPEDTPRAGEPAPHSEVAREDARPGQDVSAWARAIVGRGDLASKLTPPPAHLAPTTSDDAVWLASQQALPARDAAIAMARRSDKLPKMGALVDGKARAVCLSRFAHHELCAVELFAWALLKFPALPAALQRGLVQTLAEEQVHCGLYLERLRAHGVELGALPLSDYFWLHANKIETPLAFLCAMGLTLEQANLDFTLMFRDGFRAAGDEESARVIERVHQDEIGHVALAVLWTKKLSAGDADSYDEVAAYEAHAPFPFSLARAKGRRFDRASRARAGLSARMVDAVERARPYVDGPRR